MRRNHFTYHTMSDETLSKCRGRIGKIQMDQIAKLLVTRVDEEQEMKVSVHLGVSRHRPKLSGILEMTGTPTMLEVMGVKSSTFVNQLFGTATTAAASQLPLMAFRAPKDDLVQVAKNVESFVNVLTQSKRFRDFTRPFVENLRNDEGCLNTMEGAVYMRYSTLERALTPWHRVVSEYDLKGAIRRAGGRSARDRDGPSWVPWWNKLLSKLLKRCNYSLLAYSRNQTDWVAKAQEWTASFDGTTGAGTSASAIANTRGPHPGGRDGHAKQQSRQPKNEQSKEKEA